MAIEIERKFLVNPTKWAQVKKPEGENFRQAYLLTEPDRSIRIRLTPTQALLTIKGKTQGIGRSEFEYEIPMQDGIEMIDQMAVAELSKTRYTLKFEGKVWEIDEFFGKNEGLIVAEIELEDENETFIRPDWLGKEITNDVRYYNANLVLNPYENWKNQ